MRPLSAQSRSFSSSHLLHGRSLRQVTDYASSRSHGGALVWNAVAVITSLPPVRWQSSAEDTLDRTVAATARNQGLPHPLLCSPDLKKPIVQQTKCGN
jgi:hypothetical protein